MDHLPEVAVGILEVAAVTAPGQGAGRLDDVCTGRGGLGEHGLHLFARIDVVGEQDFGGRGRVLRQAGLGRQAVAGDQRLLDAVGGQPVAGLQPKETIEVDRLVFQVADSSVTVVLLEHDTKMVMNLSDRMWHAFLMTPLLASAFRVLGLALAALSATPAARAIEEPAFEVIRSLTDEVELRRYAPYVVAEVQVPGPAGEAGNRAFPILAGYIFGKNKGQRTLEMTAPVIQAAAPVTLPMTAPVTQAPAGEGFIVHFVLPRAVTLETAPQPLDERVRLREVPATRVAAIRFSGFWSETNYREHLARLQAVLKEAGQPWTGEPVYARYNAPFTPWFMRRNEIWLALPG